MHYLDTNVLIYSCVNQDSDKLEKSQAIIHELFSNNNLLLSPVSLQELIFTLSKIKLKPDQIKKDYDFFSRFCAHEIDRELLDSAFETASELNFGRNINDIIHLKFAEKYRTKLITYDSDFMILKPIASIEINILK